MRTKETTRLILESTSLGFAYNKRKMYVLVCCFHLLIFQSNSVNFTDVLTSRLQDYSYLRSELFITLLNKYFQINDVEFSLFLNFISFDGVLVSE